MWTTGIRGPLLAILCAATLGAALHGRPEGLPYRNAAVASAEESGGADLQVRPAPNEPVRAWEGTLTLPSYGEGAPDPNPPFDLFVTNRRFNYPYTMREELTGERRDREWRALFLENEYLRCSVLPDLGGHLYSCRDKVNGAELFYANPSIKLARIAYRGSWAAFGIEFNFPVSHNWMTTSPVDFAMTRGEDGSASVWVGNIDRPYGMQWRVELTLRPGRSVLEQRTVLDNRSDVRHRFYWWTNAAVEVWDDSRILYPMAFTASHGFRDVDTWPIDSRGTDLSVVGNHRHGPVSRFSHGSREGWMAVYHPRTRAGVVHYSAPTELPAKKIWSWGNDPDGLDWRKALSDNESVYVEIQAGLFRNQETYGFLEPLQSVSFTEQWLPIRDLGGLTRANPDAALHLVRRAGGAGSVALEVALNVTRALPAARVEVATGAAPPVARTAADLGPGATYRHTFEGLANVPAYTLTVRDRDGAVVIAHTEGRYDYTPASEIALGPQAFQGPTEAPTTAEEFLELGTDQEVNGSRLEAADTYRRGLAAHPQSRLLRRALGRLEVGLGRVDDAVEHLTKALAQVTTDYEATYYLGLAQLGRGEIGRAREAWQLSEAYGAWRVPSLLGLARLAALDGNVPAALGFVRQAVADAPDAVRLGGIEVALLRAAGAQDEARARLSHWRGIDPSSSLLRHEATKLGGDDPALWPHLAADPERILEVAVEYTRLGLFADAEALLARDWPSGPAVLTEPGMPHPSAYPLMAYFRGYCRARLGRDGRADYDAASRMSTLYVFPNRPETAAVLRAALEANPRDATAHALLGSLYLAGGLVDEAMREWEAARAINPSMPALHRNMATTLMVTGGSLERAIELYRGGTRHDSRNVSLYAGLDAALAKAGRPAAERADALLTFPDPKAMPNALVFRLARVLAQAERVDQAEQLFRGRFFAREEGGTNVREVWLDVRLTRAEALAASGACADARLIVSALARPVDGLAFTRDGLDAFLARPAFKERIARLEQRCAPQP